MGIGPGAEITKVVTIEAGFIPVFAQRFRVQLVGDAILEALDQIFVCKDVMMKQLRGVKSGQHSGRSLQVTHAVYPLDEDLE